MCITNKRRHRLELNSNRINFPNICPVCEDRATNKGAIRALKPSRNSYSSYAIRRGWDRSVYNGRSTLDIIIPTCEAYASRSDENLSAKGSAAACFGISAIFFIILFSSLILNYIEYGLVFYTPMVPVTILLFITLVSTWHIIGPSALEKAVEITNIDDTKSLIMFRFSSRGYRNKLYDLNQHIARRPKW